MSLHHPRLHEKQKSHSQTRIHDGLFHSFVREEYGETRHSNRSRHHYFYHNQNVISMFDVLLKLVFSREKGRSMHLKHLLQIISAISLI